MHPKTRESTPLSTFFCMKNVVNTHKISILTIFAYLKGLKMAISG